MFKKIISLTNLFRSGQPLTLRAILIIVLSTFAIREYAIANYDLVTDIICKSLLCLIVILSIISIVYRIKIAQKLKIEAIFNNTTAVSNKKIESSLILSCPQIPLLFSLKLSRIFKEKGVITFEHIVRGNIDPKEKKYLLDYCIFPHRGFWEIRGIKVSLEDSLGLTSYTWDIELTTGIEVSPEKIEISPLPIVASSSKSGDTSTDSKERTGDLYDIKPYDPSDGTRKILWKTYAKSGQLISRKPEPAIVPEGEIALYLVANKKEDYVAAACISYLSMLFESEINVLFGTDGSTEITNDIEKIKKAINYNVWNKNCGTAKDFDNYLKSLGTLNKNIFNIVIFGPQRSDWQETINNLSNIKVTFVIVPQKLITLQQSIKKKFFWSKKQNKTNSFTPSQNPGSEYIFVESKS